MVELNEVIIRLWIAATGWSGSATGPADCFALLSTVNRSYHGCDADHLLSLPVAESSPDQYNHGFGGRRKEPLILRPPEFAGNYLHHNFISIFSVNFIFIKMGMIFNN